jgi:nitroreductase
MNQIIENIKARRAVRSYSDKAIDRETLEAIIEAGAWAPSGVNSQPWRFVIIESDAFRKKMATMALPYYKQWLQGLPAPARERIGERGSRLADPVYYGATAVVFVIGSGMTSDFDCAMACQNIMLAARSFGIGSCWVYTGSLVAVEKEMKDALELKEGESIYGPIVLGYPKDVFPNAPERKPLVAKWL